MLRWAIWIGLLAAVVAGALFYFRPFAPVEVAVGRPTRGPAVEAVYATGIVEAANQVRVAAEAIGRLESLRVREGDQVRAGDVLATLDDEEERYLVKELEARLALERDEERRAESLLKRGTVSRVTVDRARAARRSTEAALSAASARLARRTVRAPINGTVLRSIGQHEVGETVTRGEVLFTVGDPSRLLIEAEIDEEDIPSVKVGQTALLRADAFPDRALEAELTEITPLGDALARAYRSHLALPADTPLLPGMTAEINIVVRETADALLVPASALDGDRVWVFADGHVQEREVQVGTIGEERAEIVSGLDGEEDIVLDPPAGLTDGERVKLRSAADGKGA